jgi:DNA helicase-2/ATP-dependent DNA helicase PcrA
MGFSAEQKLAIEYIGGPQIVLAGPGSGKTLIIVEKAAYLVEQKGIKPDEILILTYNNFTADELNNRLRKRGKEKPLPEAKTFHSFGQRVIEQRYEILGYKDVPTVLGSYRKYLIQREAYFEAAEIPPGLSSPDNITMN